MCAVEVTLLWLLTMATHYGYYMIQARFEVKFDEGTHAELLQQQRDLTLGYAQARALHTHCTARALHAHCTRTALHAHCTCTARALHAHCTARALHAHGMSTACALQRAGDADRRAAAVDGRASDTDGAPLAQAPDRARDQGQKGQRQAGVVVGKGGDRNRHLWHHCHRRRPRRVAVAAPGARGIRFSARRHVHALWRLAFSELTAVASPTA